MALTVNKSMNIGDFLENWQHIAALVESEYEAVKDYPDGYYDLRLDLIWDCEEDEGIAEWPEA